MRGITRKKPKRNVVNSKVCNLIESVAICACVKVDKSFYDALFGSVGEEEGFGVGELLGEDEGSDDGGNVNGSNLIEGDGAEEGAKDSEGETEINTVGLADGESEEVGAGGARLKLKQK